MRNQQTSVDLTYEQGCATYGDDGRAVRSVLDRICNKWSMLIVGTLHGERLRFTELQQHIPGISQRMLSLTLRHLERDGLVSREAFAEVPPRVEYELTPMGETLIEPARALADWAFANNLQIEQRRAAYDARTAAVALA